MQKYNNIVTKLLQMLDFTIFFNDFVKIFYKTIIFAEKINLWRRKKFHTHLL